MAPATYSQDTAVVTVANVAPTATLSNNGPVTTGNPVTISFSNQQDVSSADTTAGFKYSYDFNNDGTFDVVDSANASASTTFATSGTHVVKGRIKDKDGGFTVTLTVTNGAGHTCTRFRHRHRRQRCPHRHAFEQWTRHRR